jgi:hypothetical protein
MALSAHRGKPIQIRHSEHEPWPAEKNPGCVLASLMSQSLAVYIELEKAHWHLRLNSTGYVANLEYQDPTEIARETCTVSLRLVASISQLQRALNPKASPECAALFAAIKEKIAELCELANGSQCDPTAYIVAIPGRPRTQRPSSKAFEYAIHEVHEEV